METLFDPGILCGRMSGNPVDGVSVEREWAQIRMLSTLCASIPFAYGTVLSQTSEATDLEFALSSVTSAS